MKKVFVILLVFNMFIGMFTGCSHDKKIDTTSEETTGKSEEPLQLESDLRVTYKFGATYMTLNNPFFVLLNNGIRDVVEANGDILIALDHALDLNKQINQI